MNQFPIDAGTKKLKASIKDWELEKKSSDVYDGNGNNGSGLDSATPDMDEEAPLIPSSRLSHIGQTQTSNLGG